MVLRPRTILLIGLFYYLLGMAGLYVWPPLLGLHITVMAAGMGMMLLAVITTLKKKTR